MKKLIISFVFVFITTGVLLGQAPEAFNYQAAVRDNNDDLITNTLVNLRMSIHQSTANGTIIYQERFNDLLTSEFGLVTLSIGQGTPVIGNFSSINWGVESKYLEVEFELAPEKGDGGIDFITMGTSQLMSVPFALYAKSAETSDDGDWTINGNDMYSSPSGNVGIGTNDPDAKLEVFKTAYLGGDGNVETNELVGTLGWYNNDANSLNQLVAGIDVKNTGGHWWDGSIQYLDASMIFNTMEDGIVSESMRIRHDGNVGIGVTNPAYKLHLEGNSGAEGEAVAHFVNNYTSGSDGGFGIYAECAGADYNGTGGFFKGGFHGVTGVVSPTADKYYSGVFGYVSGGSGTNHGVLGTASGGTNNYAIYGLVGSGANDYAGYFEGKLHCTSNATIDGSVGIGITPDRMLHVEGASETDEAVGHFVNTFASGVGYEEGIGVYGECTGADYRGHGGLFKGGFHGVGGIVNPSSDKHYVGTFGYVSGGTGTNYGAYGYATNGATNYAVYGITGSGIDDYAGYFEGKIYATASNASIKAFKIDHPADPQNKYLYHSSVESPEMMNVYNGNVILNSKGEALVKLPDYFELLNTDFRYQLTCIGDFAPVFIAEKINNNQFQIGGGKPGMEVSWQVTGVRHDPVAVANRIETEVDKSNRAKGKYLNPEAYGQPKSMGETYNEDMEKHYRSLK